MGITAEIIEWKKKNSLKNPKFFPIGLSTNDKQYGVSINLFNRSLQLEKFLIISNAVHFDMKVKKEDNFLQ